MNQQIKGLVYFYLTNMRHSIIIFWSILIGIILFSLLLAYLLAHGDGIFMLTITGPIYVYFGIYGYLVVKNWLPFLIKIGATRKNVFISLAYYFTALAVVFSLIGLSLNKLITPIADHLEIEIFFFAHLANLLNEAWYEIVLIDIVICLFFFATSFLIGLIKHRYGLLISGSFIGLVFLIGILGLYHGWLIDFFIYIYNHFDLMLFVKLGIISIIIYAFTWLFLRRASIVSVR